jgi:hypothetical protein
MPSLPVSIVRFVDETQPGIVECEFTDAYQRAHRLVDKVPIFSERNLWKDSQYPQPGTVDCRIDAVFSDALGRELARITIGCPDESVDGETEFVVERSRIIDDPAT